jgi:hypothetical protein
VGKRQISPGASHRRNSHNTTARDRRQSHLWVKNEEFRGIAMLSVAGVLPICSRRGAQYAIMASSSSWRLHSITSGQTILNPHVHQQVARAELRARARDLGSSASSLPLSGRSGACQRPWPMLCRSDTWKTSELAGDRRGGLPLSKITSDMGVAWQSPVGDSTRVPSHTGEREGWWWRQCLSEA